MYSYICHSKVPSLNLNIMHGLVHNAAERKQQISIMCRRLKNLHTLNVNHPYSGNVEHKTLFHNDKEESQVRLVIKTGHGFWVSIMINKK